MARFTALCTRRITSKKMYQYYLELNPDSQITYRQYKDIIEDAHKMVVDMCMEGGTYNFGSGVGRLSVKKFEKKIRLDENGNPTNLSVDFGATRKHKAAGGSNVIYHPTGMKAKWHWAKKDCHIPNKSGWSLVPTDGPKGISRKLSNYVKKNSLAILKYPLLQVKKKNETQCS